MSLSPPKEETNAKLHELEDELEMLMVLWREANMGQATFEGQSWLAAELVSLVKQIEVLRGV